MITDVKGQSLFLKSLLHINKQYLTLSSALDLQLRRQISECGAVCLKAHSFIQLTQAVVIYQNIFISFSVVH